MSSTAVPRRPIRPSAMVNAEIRREVERARFERREMDHGRYTELLEEWAEARRQELTAVA
ncbi:hypothetical protein ACFQLX_01580 [Streptomyces polyrhachis]|uniref:Uncharacterized protein n=1 Tax=Streptomyces polyrhachis TaxID=1282885 RepID=A0ABW2GDQ3_9ACTN